MLEQLIEIGLFDFVFGKLFQVRNFLKFSRHYFRIYSSAGRVRFYLKATFEGFNKFISLIT